MFDDDEDELEDFSEEFLAEFRAEIAELSNTGASAATIADVKEVVEKLMLLSKKERLQAMRLLIDEGNPNLAPNLAALLGVSEAKVGKVLNFNEIAEQEKAASEKDVAFGL